LTTSIPQGGIARPSVDGFDSERFRKEWVVTFGELRRELKSRMNIWSPKKRDGKLNYMHNNPVKRGLVKHPGEWPWSRRGGEVLFLE
jgi:REP element-mobilizing transposase RayT